MGKLKPAQNSSCKRRMYNIQPLAEKLLAVDSFWEKECQLSSVLPLLCWPHSIVESSWTTQNGNDGSKKPIKNKSKLGANVDESRKRGIVDEWQMLLSLWVRIIDALDKLLEELIKMIFWRRHHFERHKQVCKDRYYVFALLCWCSGWRWIHAICIYLNI